MNKENQFFTLKRETSAICPSRTGTDYPELHALAAPHVDSFNAMFDQGLLANAVKNLDSVQAVDKAGNKLTCWIENVQVARPMNSERDKHSINRLVYPNECRERGITYGGKIQMTFAYSVNDGPAKTMIKELGHMPIMTRSTRCNIANLSPAQLVARKEDSEEWGGTFIVNGIERLIRLLILPRRHYVMNIVRPSFANRGPLYSPYGAMIRCVRDDETSQTVTLHYLNDGNIMLRFYLRKQEYLVPLILILKALADTNDKEIYEMILQNDHTNTFLSQRVELLLRNAKAYPNLFTKEQCLAYLGSRFRVVLLQPDDTSDVDIGRDLLEKHILVHLNDPRDKFNLLIFMARKLYALVAGDTIPDNADSPMHQEVLLPGHLFNAYFKEKLEQWLRTMRSILLSGTRRGQGARADFMHEGYVKACVGKVPSDLGKAMQYFLATGNLVSYTGLDLQQTSGFTIVAEKLNFYRYIAHFRSIHRGAFFSEMKTTSVRKLLPEAWGYLCPVHTPDGSPCGLLNHLAHKCHITMTARPDVSHLPALLTTLGMMPLQRGLFPPATYVPIQLDGRWIGHVSPTALRDMTTKLRYLKSMHQGNIHPELEIGYIPTSRGGLYPGLYLFSRAARFSRPVKNLTSQRTEMIGSLAQVHMDIACVDAEIVPGLTTHVEEAPTNMLSVIANLTPFSDFNQSPRNMYQCQMGKQAMGTPTHSNAHRSDNKLFRLHTGQVPIVRPTLHNNYGFDLYPNGMNAVVAVISYTGYDMEDAMILNKSAYERGFGHGSIYKTQVIDIARPIVSGEGVTHFFAAENRKLLDSTLDVDGLPKVGVLLRPGDAIACVLDNTTGQYRVEKYKGMEDAWVDQVRLIGDDSSSMPLQKIHVKLRVDRNPIIGDKFSSRHGQKGVCSQKWPMIDMPFSESGMTPDIIINPHAFPSRMTIGMFVESLAGKAGAMHGICQDATPFKFNEDHTASDYFGEQLKQAGYNYHGNEPMYSGITGKEFKADIYIGVVYYQRLRHMVSDKFQVRTTGPIDNLTQQPVKGRKRAGGIRFGEMERDSLLAHGTASLLKDRLVNCSDYAKAFVCKSCGSILSPMHQPGSSVQKTQVTCRYCDTPAHIDAIAIPYVFRYLVTELMAMNIKISLNV